MEVWSSERGRLIRTMGISSLPEAIHMTLTPVEYFAGGAGMTGNGCSLMNQWTGLSLSEGDKVVWIRKKRCEG